MTMILACMSQEYILQVSDRRLSSRARDGPTHRIMVRDNSANKAVLFCDHFAFSYTGLAELEGDGTDVWLAREISKAKCSTINEALVTLQQKATVAVHRLPSWHTRADRRLAFIATGWTYVRQSDNTASCNRLEPVVALVSNFHDSDGTQLDLSADAFQLKLYGLNEGEPVALCAFGHPLARADFLQGKRSLRQTISKGLGPRPMLAILAHAIRSTAEKPGNSAVGKDLMAVSLPRRAIEKGYVRKGDDLLAFTLSLAPTKGARTFLYMPESGAPPVEFAPIFVCGGRVIHDYKYATTKDGYEVSYRDGLRD